MGRGFSKIRLSAREEIAQIFYWQCSRKSDVENDDLYNLRDPKPSSSRKPTLTWRLRKTNTRQTYWNIREQILLDKNRKTAQTNAKHFKPKKNFFWKKPNFSSWASWASISPNTLLITALCIIDRLHCCQLHLFSSWCSVAMLCLCQLSIVLWKVMSPEFFTVKFRGLRIVK